MAWIARPWSSHAATTVGRVTLDGFVPIAECGGHGRPAAEDEALAGQIVAQRAALAQLLDVCERMDAEHHGKPSHASEGEYLAALAAARAALGGA
jgi:L-alanine-DL-glutamate epimerase-like enolase superfamily enzyme